MESKAPKQIEASQEDLLDSESKHFQQFQKFFVPIYSPRTSYSLQREQELHMFQQLTAHFDPFTINFLKSEFEQRKGTLSLHEFILVLRRHLLQWEKGLEAREARLTQLLASIFHQVNTSEMQRITWEQFSFYLIGKATALSRKVLTKPEQTVKQYSLALDIHLTARANDVFTSIVALPNLNRVAIITDKSDELRFFNLNNGTEDVKPLYLDQELAHLRNIQRRKYFKRLEIKSPIGKRNISSKGASGSYQKKPVASAKRRDIE